MVVLKKNLSVEKGEKVLFDDIRYYFSITTLRDRTAEEVVALANGGECDRAVEEWGECDEVAGERFGEQLGIHGNSVIGMESQGVVWVVDAECGKGDAGSEDGVSAVSQYPDKNSVSNTEDGPQDCVSGAWV